MALARPVRLDELQHRVLYLTRFVQLVALAQGAGGVDDGAADVGVVEERAAVASVQ